MKILLISCIIIIASVNEANSQSKDLFRLLSYMEGEFSSEIQANTDSAYYPIFLGMYRIWPNQVSGGWFYVEQAMMSKKDKPYRQRIYHVYQIGSTFLSDIYTFENPLDYVGNIEKVQKINMENLILKEGCTVYLNKSDGKSFKGKTHDKTCESTLRGASYATSEVEIHPKSILSWDRGFDNEANQVWGAEKGAYIFKKIK